MIRYRSTSVSAVTFAVSSREGAFVGGFSRTALDVPASSSRAPRAGAVLTVS